MKKIILIAIHFYARILSPLLHQLVGVKTACRQTPTCSAYAQHVIEHYGVFKGMFLSVRRLVNCQPFFNL